LGKSFDLIHAAGRAPRALRYIQQAFLSFKPRQARGLQLDFGQFTSSAGQEEIETHNNWNYSRSLLFTCAVPYYHFGLRATLPVRKNWSAGLQLVNGWNNVKDNNAGKTLGLTAEFASSKVSWSQAYYMGPEKDRSNQGWRYLYDTEVELSPGRNTRLYLNFAYGAEKEPGGGLSRTVLPGALVRREPPPGVVPGYRRSDERHGADPERVHPHRGVQDRSGHPDPARVPPGLVQPAVLPSRRHPRRQPQPGHPAGRLHRLLRRREVGTPSAMGQKV